MLTVNYTAHLGALQVERMFMPTGVTDEYKEYTLWRVAQRLVSSAVGVFGTQALSLTLPPLTQAFSLTLPSSPRHSLPCAHFLTQAFSLTPPSPPQVPSLTQALSLPHLLSFVLR